MSPATSRERSSPSLIDKVNEERREGIRAGFRAALVGLLAAFVVMLVLGMASGRW
jgi:hypothetical protein